MSNRIEVDQRVLKWAIDESQIPYDNICSRFNKMDKWLRGEESPTFVQLKELSNYLKVPFGYMFLKEPPNVDSIKKEFRTIDNKVNYRLSKDLMDVLFDMEFKKNWMSEYRKMQGWDPIEFNGNIELNSLPKEVAKYLYNILELENDWYVSVKDAKEAFNYLRNRMERIGIIIMMSGIVGQNTHRTLDIKEFRAFALIDKYAPLIFINRQDSDTGMIFSLVHEFIHIILDSDDIIIDEEIMKPTSIEKTINSYVAEFLMPSHKIETVWKGYKDSIKEINDISKIFKVSPSALTIKLYEMNLVDRNIVNTIFAITKANIKAKKRSPGGNYYNTLNSRISKSFSDAVINQTEIGALRYTDAYHLLGISGKAYQQYCLKKARENE